MKKMCVQLSGIGALLICAPVVYRILQGDSFNPTSYFLWSALSVLCSTVLYRAGKGGHVMMIGYTLSDLIIAIASCIKKGQMVFGKFELFVVILTTICAAVYVRCEVKKSYTASVILNGIACIVAGVPFFWESIQDPQGVSLWISCSYAIISSLGYYGETSFNGKFIPGISVVYWLAIIARKIAWMV
jgi:hypothetical protein